MLAPLGLGVDPVELDLFGLRFLVPVHADEIVIPSWDDWHDPKKWVRRS